MTLNLPPTVQAFHEASAKLTTAKDKKEYNKISLVALKQKRQIIPSEMVDVLQQIDDEVLRGKVAGLISFDMGEKCKEGLYRTLYPVLQCYPKDLHPDDEPKQKDVYDCLIAIGYSHKQSQKMSTISDDVEGDGE